MPVIVRTITMIPTRKTCRARTGYETSGFLWFDLKSNCLYSPLCRLKLWPSDVSSKWLLEGDKSIPVVKTGFLFHLTTEIMNEKSLSSGYGSRSNKIQSVLYYMVFSHYYQDSSCTHAVLNAVHCKLWKLCLSHTPANLELLMPRFH